MTTDLWIVLGVGLNAIASGFLFIQWCINKGKGK